MASMAIGVVFLLMGCGADAKDKRGSVSGVVGDIGDRRGAQVVVVGTSPDGAEIVRSGVLDPSGRFHVMDLPPGETYQMFLITAGSPPTHVPVPAVQAGSVTDVGALSISAPGTLLGRVTAARAVAVPNARVSLHASTRSWLEYEHLPIEPTMIAAPLSVTSTDEAGAFAFDGLRAGPYTVVVEAQGYCLALSRALVPIGSAGRQLIELQPCSPLRGRVSTESGRPVASARVLVSAGHSYVRFPGYYRISTLTGSDGEFSVHSPPPRSSSGYHIRVSVEGYPDHVIASPSAGPVDVTLRKESIVKIHLTDARTRQPLAGVDLVVVTADSSDMRGLRTVSAIRTNEAGEASAASRSGYLLAVSARHPNLAGTSWPGGLGGLDGPPEEERQVQPGENHFRFRYQGHVSVRGRVLNAQKQPLSGARCSIVMGGHGVTGSRRADPEGEFELLVSHLDWLDGLSVTAPGYVQVPYVRPPDGANVDVGADVRVDVVLRRPVSIVGRVVDEEGRPVSGATVEAMQMPGGEPWDPLGRVGVPTAILTATGWYIIEGVPPELELEIVGGGSSSTGRFTTGEQGPTLAPLLRVNR
jgi:hypothetical protein